MLLFNIFSQEFLTSKENVRKRKRKKEIVALTHNSCRVGEATRSSSESVSRCRILQAAAGRSNHRQDQQEWPRVGKSAAEHFGDILLQRAATGVLFTCWLFWGPFLCSSTGTINSYANRLRIQVLCSVWEASVAANQRRRFKLDRKDKHWLWFGIHTRFL